MDKFPITLFTIHLFPTLGILSLLMLGLDITIKLKFRGLDLTLTKLLYISNGVALGLFLVLNPIPVLTLGIKLRPHPSTLFQFCQRVISDPSAPLTPHKKIVIALTLFP